MPGALCVIGEMVKGSCSRALVCEIDRLNGPILHCHRTSCRKAHAAAFASTAGVGREHFRWTEGEENLSFCGSSPGKRRYFCSVCGSYLVVSRDTQAHVVLCVATLDEDPHAGSQAHIWASQNVPWLKYGEAVPSYSAVLPSTSGEGHVPRKTED
jgi:hypothetical protein